MELLLLHEDYSHEHHDKPGHFPGQDYMRQQFEKIYHLLTKKNEEKVPI